MPNTTSFSWSFTVEPPAFTVDSPTFELFGSVLAEKKIPIAVAVASPEYAVMGSVIKLNGQQSYDPGAVAPRSGNDVTSVSGDLIMLPSAALSSQDLGRSIKITGPNAGEYRIVEVIGPTRARVTTPTGGGVLFSSFTSEQWVIEDQLYYSWSVVRVPVGSTVGQESFRLLDEDASIVSFSPDVVGEYVMQLVVSNGAFESEPSLVNVSVRSILVPHARGLVPDGKFIWSYIRDVWSQVDGREWFETLWSALIQISGSELLKLYQADFNKSIRDIQDNYQRRWMSYEPKLALVEDDCMFFLGNHCAGTAATTRPVGVDGQIILVTPDVVPATWSASTSYALGDFVAATASNAASGCYFQCTLAGTSGAVEPEWPSAVGDVVADGTARWQLVSLLKEMIVVQGTVFPSAAGRSLRVTYDSSQPKNVRDFTILSLNSAKTGYLVDTTVLPADPFPGRVSFQTSAVFAFRSKEWVASARVGDVFHFSAGPNAGYYRVVESTGTTVVVDKTPPGFSDATTLLSYKPNVYRPVGYRMSASPAALTETIGVPYEAGTNDLSVVAPGRILTTGTQAHTILRATVDREQMVPMTVVITEEADALANLGGMSWRAPHTLVSASQNFEELGVSTGDLLVFSLTDQASQSSVDVSTQVVGVSGNRLGFVLTTEQTVAGEIPPIPDSTFVDIANAFNISSLSRDQYGSLTFSGEAASLIADASSGTFKRKYWNRELTPETDISVAKRTFRIHPKHIVRNRLVPVDSTLLSAPMLQEWIVTPSIVKRDGKVYQEKNGIEYELPGVPAKLIENLDYVIDSEYSFDGEMRFDTGTDVVFVEGANFVDRGITAGDEFIIDLPVTLAGTYYIAAVLDPDRLKLSRPVPRYIIDGTVTARVRIQRKRSGHFLRFTPGTFSAAAPAPERLWSEVSFFDNSDAIEANFGLMVGLKKDDLEKISSTANYKQAVAGLMFAYTRGSIINKIKLGAQILLGLPFVEHRGIIRSIEPDYRLDDKGNPKTGRILIEDVDQTREPLGTYRIYTYPIDASSEDLAGIDINPETGAQYAVGDYVEQFASIVKGVEVLDYISEPTLALTPEKRLQQFHSVRMRANDNVFSIDELSLVSAFLKRITPSYIALAVETAMEFVDYVKIDDRIYKALLNRDSPFVDNPFWSLSTPAMFDIKLSGDFYLGRWDDGMFQVRKRWASLNSTTLQGGPGSPQSLFFPSGGFLIPTAGEGPVVRPGDKITIKGEAHQGVYTISAVPSDEEVIISDGPEYGLSYGFYRYAIVRPVQGELRRGVLSGSGRVVACEPGLQADGVAPGDLLVVDLGAGRYSRHRVTRVGPIGGVPELVAGDLEVTPETSSVSGAPYTIYRDVFVQSPYPPVVEIISDGTEYSGLSDVLVQGLLEPGDELEPVNPVFARLTALDPARNVFVPVLPSGTYEVRVCKKGQPATPVGLDHLARLGPAEEVDLAILGTNAVTVAGSKTVTFGEIANPAQHPLLPGDMLVLLSGADSAVDVGYGLGVYPLVEVTSANVKLAENLTTSGTFAWKVIRRRH